MAVFIDSSVLCSYANAKDIHHYKSVSLINEIAARKYGNGIITDYVFDETVTVALRRTNKKTAIGLGNLILNSELLMAKVSPIVFKKAWEFFQKDHNFSFTDCTIIAFMQTFDIKTIATFDNEFKNLKNFEVIDK